MNIRDVELLLALAKSGSLSRVAAALETTQPRVSERLKHIEDEIGSRLFFRTARGVSLTSAGEKFLPFARVIADAYSQGMQDVTDLESAVRGKLHIGMTHTHPDVLPKIMLAFQKRYQDIDVIISRPDPTQMCNEVLAKHFDIGLCFEPLNYEALVWEPLFVTPMVVVAAIRTHMPKRTTLASLSAYPLVLAPTTCSLRLRLDQAARDQGVNLKIRMEIDDPQTWMNVVKSGDYIAVAPKTKVPASRMLKISRLLEPEMLIQGGLLRRTEIGKPAKLFAAFLRAQLSLLSQDLLEPSASPCSLPPQFLIHSPSQVGLG